MLSWAPASPTYPGGAGVRFELFVIILNQTVSSGSEPQRATDAVIKHCPQRVHQRLDTLTPVAKVRKRKHETENHLTIRIAIKICLMCKISIFLRVRYGSADWTRVFCSHTESVCVWSLSVELGLLKGGNSTVLKMIFMPFVATFIFGAVEYPPQSELEQQLNF